jgi:hypothetical protein
MVIRLSRFLSLCGGKVLSKPNQHNGGTSVSVRDTDTEEQSVITICELLLNHAGSAVNIQPRLVFGMQVREVC